MADVSFGEWLQRQRKAQGLTQQQLAVRINCSLSALRKFEADIRRPSAQMADLLAGVFAIPPTEKPRFYQFARGDWGTTFSETVAEMPWKTIPVHTRSNVPSPTTALIGREKEITDLRQYLLRASIRLVTLIGPPGIGKTRLSIEAARTELPDFSDGVFFVALAALDDPSHVAGTILQTLGYVEVKGQTALERLVEGIGNKEILLVLDNFEHILEGASPLVAELLAVCPLLKILVTSRESLRIPGEWVYVVPALGLPEEKTKLDAGDFLQYSALVLFAERARAARPDFELGVDNIQAVSAICARLDGLPLAIELIAARSRLMSPFNLLERLNYQIILATDSLRTVSTRQKTLHNAIGWSYDLLSSDERKLFERLAIFAGGFTLDAVETIFSDLFSQTSISSLMTSLLDKSLLQNTLEVHSEPRFRMLVTIQQFALEHLKKLGQEATLRDQHLEYFQTLVERGQNESRGPNQVAWGQRLENEIDNINQAFEWAVLNHKTESALRMLLGLGWSWDMRCHYGEARGWFERINALTDVSLYPILYAKLLNQIGRHSWVLGDFSLARTLLEQSLAIWQNMENPPDDGLAETLEYLGMISWMEDNINAADELFKESLNLYQKSGHRRGNAECVFFLGIVEFVRGNQTLALSRFEHSLDLFTLLKDLWGIAKVSQLLGELFLQQTNYDKARLFYEQHLKIDEELQDKEGIVVALARLGSFYRQQGDDQQASWYLERSRFMASEYDLKGRIIDASCDLGYIALKHDDFSLAAKYFWEGIANARKISPLRFAGTSIAGLAAVAAGRNQPELSAVLFGAALAISPAIQNDTSSINAIAIHRLLDSARNQLDAKRFETLQAEGRGMTFDQAIDFALSNGL